VGADPVKPVYVCGHTPRERERLDLQGSFYEDITRRALVEGGIGPGMRVLDIGCGTGAVTLLAAGLVGPSGAVAGVDRDPEAVAAAQARARARGATDVSFHRATIGDAGEADPTAGAPDFRVGGWDAVVGRFVLMHQRDPAATLARAASLLRPGGRVVLVESAMAGLLGAPHSEPWCSLYDRVVRWTCAVVEAGGADLRAGLRLRRVFAAAGLPAPTTLLEARVEGGPSSPLYRYCAESVRSMLPLAERFGIEGFDAASVDTLEGALRDTAVAGGHALVSWPVVAAWCRLPETPTPSAA
jgi:SAM-dependent methyltransferase